MYAGICALVPARVHNACVRVRLGVHGRVRPYTRAYAYIHTQGRVRVRMRVFAGTGMGTGARSLK